jgi:BirA family biotin operon repressor/biotin-[acetyl-CoA-carboxylase] ligase
MTRAWFSPPGANLYFSLLLRPEVELSRAASLPLVMGLAVAEALRGLAPAVAARVKWPNDILVRGRNLSGVLVRDAA